MFGMSISKQTDESVEVKELLCENIRITIHELADMLGISFG
jgi:hypothetical protein